MRSFVLRFCVLIVVVTAMTLLGCDFYGRKKAVQQTYKDFKEVEAIAKVGVTVEAYEKALKKAQLSAQDALGKLDEGDLRNAVQAVHDTYTDAKVVVEKPGELDTGAGPFGDLANRYGLKKTSRYVPQFALLKKIFDRGTANLKALNVQIQAN